MAESSLGVGGMWHNAQLGWQGSSSTASLARQAAPTQYRLPDKPPWHHACPTAVSLRGASSSPGEGSVAAGSREAGMSEALSS